MTGHGKSFDERFRELIKQGKSRTQALNILLEERKLELRDVPSKHKAKPKEGKRDTRAKNKRSRRG